MSDAAGNVGAGARNLAVRDRKGRTARRFATAGFGYDGDVPKPVIGRLGGGGSRRKCGSSDENGARKYRTNAKRAHESDPRIAVMTPGYWGTLCSKFAAPRQCKKFPRYQTFEVNIGSRPGTGIRPESVQIAAAGIRRP